jgi:outer membrane protein insertion porin family
MNLLFYITILSLFASQCLAKTLGTITVEGIHSQLAATAKDKLQHLLPHEFNIMDIEKSLEWVNKLGSFNGIEVYYDELDSGKTNVVYKFLPVHLIRSIRFTGNSHFGSFELLPELGFNENESLSQDKIQSAVDSIKKFYNLNGYLNAQVSADVSLQENSSDVGVNISIDEQDPCVIHSISFKSVNENLNKLLYKNIKSHIKNIFTQSTLNDMQSDSTNLLFSESYFTALLQAPEMTYNAAKTEVDISYVIGDPYSYSLVFEGNTVFNDVKLKKELKITPDNRLSTSAVDDINERIIRYYKKNGYANISIVHSENLFAQDFLRRLNFNITEGSKVRIKDILFEGTLSRPPKYYKNFILDHSSELVSSKTYNSDDIDQGIKNLTTELQNQGFLAAKIPTVRSDFDKTRTLVTIKVTLDEGPQTLIKEIIFRGLSKISHAEIEGAIGLAAGQPLQLNRLEESANRIIDTYRNKGYLDVQVLNKDKSLITYSADNTQATLIFDINEGPLITVSNIVIEGNTFTKQYVISRELQFHEGEILTPEKLSYTEQRLQRLSIFNSIDIHTLDDDPRNGNRTVLVHVSEHNPGIFKGGIGVNNDLTLTLKGFVGIAYRNLFGTGRGINSRIEIDEKLKSPQLDKNFTEYSLNVGYTEPFVFGFAGTGRVNLVRSNKLFSIDTVAHQTIADDNAQGDLIYERDLTRKIKLIYEVYGLAQIRTYDIFGKDTPDPSPRNPKPVPLNSAPLLIGTTGPAILFEGRDNIFNPTRGYDANISLEFSSPYLASTQTVAYYRTIEEYTRYIPLGPVVWANKGKIGYERNLSTLQDGAIPEVKTFFLGGQSTIRGFSPTEAFPFSQTDVQNGIPTEEFLILAKSELRFPISGNLGGAIFYDGGQVGSPTYHPQFLWRDAIGAGLRYNTPVGPVSLEIGFKLNQDTNRFESPYAVQFSIGVF